MIRLGLCCLFVSEPVRYRHATARVIGKLGKRERAARLSELCLYNSRSLLDSLGICLVRGIGAFRVMSPLFPLFTHPDVGYSIGDLPDACEILEILASVRDFASSNDLRLSFHPDQFVVINSPRESVVASSVRELEYQHFLADLIGADVINIHVGGAYGEKAKAIKRFVKVCRKLPSALRGRLSVENDDKTYTPADLDRVCAECGIPMVYDIHHHRCNPDVMSAEEASDLASETWKAVGKETYFHISSPKSGWSDGRPEPHADFIDTADFPECWLARGHDFTLDVEAKSKELAVERLRGELENRGAIASVGTKTGGQMTDDGRRMAV
ncbi:MAG: UV DNA damage repair endonuclease UvsE [Victivallales bacterium]|nr:UV DNA damage repair endonuclease UvsE [Victivallales bacterium]